MSREKPSAGASSLRAPLLSDSSPHARAEVLMSTVAVSPSTVATSLSPSEERERDGSVWDQSAIVSPWDAPVETEDGPSPPGLEKRRGTARPDAGAHYATPQSVQVQSFAYVGCSARDPLMNGFCSALFLFAMIPDRWDGRPRLFLWLHQWIVRLLVCWSGIGWVIRTVYMCLRQPMPFIAGWYEVAADLDEGTPGAYCMIGTTIASYIFSTWYFSRHRGHLVSVSHHVFLDAPSSQQHIQQMVQSCLRFVYIWGIFCAVVSRVMNFMIARENGQAFWGISATEVAAVAYDTVITLLTFFVQFTSVTLTAMYFAIVCRVHCLQVQHFKEWLVSNEYSLDHVVKYHSGLCNDICRSSEYFQGFILLVVVFVGVGTIVTIVETFLNPTRVGLAFRIFYCLCYIVPVTYSLWQAAAVSSGLEDLLFTVNKLPLRTRVAESAFLNSYFAAGVQTGRLGFSLFGFVLKRELFYRAFYVIIVLFSSLAQYLSTHKTP